MIVTLEDAALFLKLSDTTDYPELPSFILAAENYLNNAIGIDWVKEHPNDSLLKFAALSLVTLWFDNPSLTGVLTDGQFGLKNIITQLQCNATK